MKVTTVGLGLAKRVFSVHGVHEHGKTVPRRQVSRGKLLELLAQRPACRVGIEACSRAHHWARRLEGLGHRLGIVAARFVAPSRKSEKNDGNDAEAIGQAGARPTMRFVPVKSAGQQALLVLDAILAKDGSIGASPHAVDIVSMAREARRAVWTAELPIKPWGVSKGKRTIGEPRFRHFTEAEGRFVNLAPMKVGASTLH